MATSVTPSTLTVTITESITLNGTSYNQNVAKSITGIGNYSKGIFTLTGGAGATSGVTHNLAEFVPTARGEKYSVEDLRYVRVTNLDSTNKVTVSFASSAAAAGVECNAGASAVLFDKRISGVASKTPVSSTKAIDTLYIHNPNASGVDVELVVATK